MLKELQPWENRYAVKFSMTVLAVAAWVAFGSMIGVGADSLAKNVFGWAKEPSENFGLFSGFAAFFSAYAVTKRILPYKL